MFHGGALTFNGDMKYSIEVLKYSTQVSNIPRKWLNIPRKCQIFNGGA